MQSQRRHPIVWILAALLAATGVSGILQGIEQVLLTPATMRWQGATTIIVGFFFLVRAYGFLTLRVLAWTVTAILLLLRTILAYEYYLNNPTRPEAIVNLAIPLVLIVCLAYAALVSRSSRSA